MFNAGFTVNRDADSTVQVLRKILSERDFKVGVTGRDSTDTLQFRAVDKSTISMLRFLFRRGKSEDPTAQRVAVDVAVMGTDGEQSVVFISVFPMMEFLPLPEIPGISESEKERGTDERVCEDILNWLCKTLKEHLPDAVENFRTEPMKKIYSIPQDNGLTPEEAGKLVAGVLKGLGFEIIRLEKEKATGVLRVRAVNHSRLHSLIEFRKDGELTGWTGPRGMARYLKDAQRVAVDVSIMQQENGENSLSILVYLYPMMEFLDIEEIHGLSQDVDEELTDSGLVRNMWDSLTSKLDSALNG